MKVLRFLSRWGVIVISREKNIYMYIKRQEITKKKNIYFF